MSTRTTLHSITLISIIAFSFGIAQADEASNIRQKINVLRGVLGAALGSSGEEVVLSMEELTDFEKKKIIEQSISDKIYHVAESATVGLKGDSSASVPHQSGSADATFHLYGGVAVPMGEFGEASGGAAQTGFILGAEVSLSRLPGMPAKLGWLTSLNVVRNGFDNAALNLPPGYTAETGSWLCVSPMTGLNVGRLFQPRVNLTLSGQIGILFANSPEITLNSNGSFLGKIAASTDHAIAFAFATSVETPSRISFGFHYLQGNPKSFGKISLIVFATGYVL